MINNPHALYYNGELVGIITNPDPIGDMFEICDLLSPDEGLAGAVTIPTSGNSEQWAAVVQALQNMEVSETIDMPSDEED